MWAIAKRDGRPAEYMWRPLFNAAVCGRPLLESLCDVRVSTFDVWVLTIGVVAAIT